MPEPKKPELVKPRALVVGSTNLAKQLLEKQREKAAAHTRAFYAQHHDGVFVAFKMTRTRVPDPKQYVGVLYFICLYVHIFICLYSYIYVFIYMYIYIFYVYIFIYFYVFYIFICLCIYLSIFLFIYLFT